MVVGRVCIRSRHHGAPRLVGSLDRKKAWRKAKTTRGEGEWVGVGAGVRKESEEKPRKGVSSGGRGGLSSANDACVQRWTGQAGRQSRCAPVLPTAAARSLDQTPLQGRSRGGRVGGWCACACESVCLRLIGLTRSNRREGKQQSTAAAAAAANHYSATRHRRAPLVINGCLSAWNELQRCSGSILSMPSRKCTKHLRSAISAPRSASLFGNAKKGQQKDDVVKASEAAVTKMRSLAREIRGLRCTHGFRPLR